MLTDLLANLFTSRAERQTHRAVEARLSRDSQAWRCSFRERRHGRHAERRATCPTPRHDWRRAIVPMAMAAGLLLAAWMGYRTLLPSTDPTQPALDASAALALGRVVTDADLAAGDAMIRPWRALADEAEAGVDRMLAFLPRAPADHGTPPTR